MPAADRSTGRVGRPPRTSRAEILEASRTILERDGWEKLTLRRLAAEVGVSAMTLYHHVEDRGDLLVQLINDELDGLPRPELPDDPRTRIITASIAIHDALAARPWIAEVVTTDGFLGRLGRSAVWMVEVIVAGAIDEGCTPEQAILVFRNIWYYTVGEILVRANTRHRRADAEATQHSALFTQPDPDIGGHAPSELPALAAVGTMWGEVAQRDTYAQGLEAIVDGLLAHAAAQRE